MARRCVGKRKRCTGGIEIYKVVWFSICARSRCGVEFAEKLAILMRLCIRLKNRGESKGSKENGGIQGDNRRV
ncbi:reverse transcriptase [Gossypium australe]|uniref:Reverse transcriptase n=1 Tax=Gossypium australe TaxID=47621 RepID=A0A5B6WYX1_9ROSI|nr:reverse transcriptase [Gossypium australe]